jgi:hypothetical protein
MGLLHETAIEVGNTQLAILPVKSFAVRRGVYRFPQHFNEPLEDDAEHEKSHGDCTLLNLGTDLHRCIWWS